MRLPQVSEQSAIVTELLVMSKIIPREERHNENCRFQ